MNLLARVERMLIWCWQNERDPRVAVSLGYVGRALRRLEESDVPRHRLLPLIISSQYLTQRSDYGNC